MICFARPRPSRSRLALLVASCLLLGACEQLGIESPERLAALREADGRAIGGACRHAGRAIEDCYTLYRKADRAAVFAGWRDMNDYMRENKIDVVAPVLSGQPPALVPTEEVAEAAARTKKIARAAP